MPAPAEWDGKRSLSSLLGKQFVNLGKDAESRKVAMKELKGYIENLDSDSVPLFLAQISRENNSNMATREHTLCLYQVFARFHGPKIVPHIDNIMLNIVTTLNSSAVSFPLQQVCSKVVLAVARYAIEPSTPQQEKVKIISSLCKPLSDLLMSRPESAASGSALCLKALAESESWRFASIDIIDDICFRIAASLKNGVMQTNSHIGLAMTLAACSSSVIEAYAEIIIQSAISMLRGGGNEINLHTKLTAIQMVNCLMKCVHMRSISGKLEDVIDVMENCDLNQKEYIRGAASEALQTAKSMRARLSGGEFNSCSHVKQSDSCPSCALQEEIVGSRFSEDRLVRPESPESQTLDYQLDDISVIESSLSSCNCEQSEWEYGNGGVDIPPAVGAILKAGSSSDLHIRDSEDVKEETDSLSISRYDQISNERGNLASSLQVSIAQSSTDDPDVFATPRSFREFIQDEVHDSFESSEKTNTSRLFGTKNNIKSGKIDARRKSRGDNFKSDTANTIYEEYEETESLKGFNMTKLAKGASILIFCCFVVAIVAVLLQTDQSSEDNFFLIPT